MPIAPMTSVRKPLAQMPTAPLRIPALRLFAACCLTATFAGMPADARANAWEKKQGDCLDAFDKPDKAESKLLLVCADTFNAEARLFNLGDAKKAVVEKGLRWLYDNGSDRDAGIAREGLFRLGIKVPVREARPNGGGKGAAEPAGPTSRPKYDPPEAREADRKAADKMAKAAVKQLVKKKWGPGVAMLDKALALDPRSEFVLYNLACGEANLPGKQKDALTHLQHLADLGTDESANRLIKARGDGDLEPLRDDVEFKRITGYARIQVLNTIGRAGEPAVENIEKLLLKLGHKKPDSSDLDKPQEQPTVLFKPHAKAQTALLAELLNHPRTRLDPIDFETKYDIVIRWGAKVDRSGDETKVESFGPDTVDESIESARRKQNKILAQPESAINKVNKVVSTPERAYGQVEAMGKRIESTGEKAKGALDKMKGLGDKLNEL